MTDFERIIKAYDSALRRTTEQLLADMAPDPDGRDHLLLMDDLLRTLVRSYSAHHLRRTGDLHSTISVMYAAEHGPDQVLDVPLRSLVDADSVSAWQARLLSGLLAMKRTLILTGAPKSGKSTLLNSVLQLVPVDERVVAIDGDPGLPVLRHRSFTVRLSADAGKPTAASLKKAAGMGPTWLVAGTVAPGDLPAFLDATGQGPAGLATLDSADPEADLADWVKRSPRLADRLAAVRPFFVHMDRDEAGRPRLAHLWETVTADDDVRLEERQQP